jgi:hypothetical protein
MGLGLKHATTMYCRLPIPQVSGWGMQQGVDGAGEGGPLTALVLAGALAARGEAVATAP